MPVGGSVLHSHLWPVSGEGHQRQIDLGADYTRGYRCMQVRRDASPTKLEAPVGQASRLTKCTSKPACECRTMPDLQIGHGVASYEVSPLTDI